MWYIFSIACMFSTVNAFSDHEKLAFCENNSNSFIAIVWPIAEGKDAQIVSLLNTYGKIVHREEKILSPAQAFIILKKSHYNAPKSVTSDFKAHLKWYFPKKSLFNKPARIFICLFTDTQQAAQCKYEIRKLFNLSYRPVHINDTHAETLELATLLFA